MDLSGSMPSPVRGPLKLRMAAPIGEKIPARHALRYQRPLLSRSVRRLAEDLVHHHDVDQGVIHLYNGERLSRTRGKHPGGIRFWGELRAKTTATAKMGFLRKSFSRKPFLIDYSRIVTRETRIMRIGISMRARRPAEKHSAHGVPIGYARVSTDDHNFALQLYAIKKSGCNRVFTDKVIGTRFVRPGLDDALLHLRASDTPAVSFSTSWPVSRRWSAS